MTQIASQTGILKARELHVLDHKQQGLVFYSCGYLFSDGGQNDKNMYIPFTKVIQLLHIISEWKSIWSRLDDDHCSAVVNQYQICSICVESALKLLFS